MSESDRHIASPGKLPPRTRHVGARRAVRVMAWSLAGVIVTVVIALTAVTLYLSDGRLTDIVNRRASEYFYADVKAGKCSFTLWSTFPRLCLEVDSLTVVSRTLHREGIGPTQRDSLPANADSLASLRRMHGSVDVLALLAGQIRLHDVTADGLRLNLVTLNDSVNNFAIVPQADSIPFNIPYISADRVSLRNVEDITVYSASARLRARAHIDNASLDRHPSEKDTYDLRLRGNLSASLDSIRLCNGLPFLFGGHVRFAFDPFAVAMHNMRVNLANTESRVSLGMNLGDNSGIDDFRTDISAFSLMKLLAYLPAEIVPDLKGLSTDLRTGLSIRLTAPYHFSEGGLPSFVAVLTVPSSSLTYTLDSGERYTINDITMHAELTFDGNDWKSSYCTIDELRARGEGLSLLLNGRLSEVFTDPRFSAKVRLSADIPELARVIPRAAKGNPAGHADIRAGLDFPVSLLTDGDYTSIPVKGEGRLTGFSLRLPDGTAVSSADTRITFDNRQDGSIKGRADVKALDVRLADGATVRTPGVGIDVVATRGGYDLTASIPVLNISGISSSVDASMNGINAAYDGSCLRLATDGLTLRTHAGTPVDVSATQVSAVMDRIPTRPSLTVSAGSAAIDLPSDRHINARGLTASSGDFTTWHFGSATTVFDMPDLDASLRRFTVNAERWNGSVALKGLTPGHMSLHIPDADIRTAAYDAPVHVSDLSADALGTDSITLHSLSIRSQMTGLRLSGGVKMTPRDGRTFYSGRASIAFDTLHFNQIARTIEHGTMYHGHATADTVVRSGHHRAFIVPDNMDFTLDATADATVYTNLWLTGLGARLSMGKGRLALDTVYLSANFGRAALAAEYLSPDADHIRLNVGAHVRDFDLTRFFRSYPNVLAMMPQMANLHGLFHADAYMTTGIFPDMDINTPSMVADVSASATDLYLHQNPFIHRVARMALIFEKGDIHIPSIHARARVYDHLLTVEPFDIRIGKYFLRAEGRNDFSGNLYYHVGVLHNPLLPFIRFGIDVKGKYHHPLIRFARSGFKVAESEKIDGIDVAFPVNLIDELRRYGLMLLHHAAKADILSSDPVE